MTALLTFAAANQALTFALAVIVAVVITAPFRYAFRAYNRTLRSRNIIAQGWPPAHVDADGDACTQP